MASLVAACTLRGGSSSWLLAVLNVVHPAYHHLIIRRVSPAHLLRGIGIDDVLLRVVEVGCHHDASPTWQGDWFLVVIGGLPAKAVSWHGQKDLRLSGG